MRLSSVQKRSAMPFTLRNAGAGCYALAFKGEHIGSAFAIEDDEQPWIVMVHDAWAARMTLPAPFETRQHRFRSLQDLKTWLRGSEGSLSATSA
jgi:hypothetical protein